MNLQRQNALSTIASERRWKAPRVAKTRNVSVEKVLELVHANTDAASLGFLGEPGVNVLMLNLALDRLDSQTANKNTEKDG